MSVYAYFKSSILALIVLFLSTHLSAGEVEFIWKKRSTPVTPVLKSKPMTEIHKDVSKSVSRYFRPRKVVNIDAYYPKEITKPREPAMVRKPELTEKLSFAQGKYESKAKYAQRVNKAKEAYDNKLQLDKKRYLESVAKRNEYIDKKTNQYKENVKKRNDKLRELQVKLDKDYKKIEIEQNKKEANVERYLPVFFKNSFKKYLQNPKILSSEYYVNDETMQVVLGSTAGNYKQNLEFKIPPKEAEKFDKSIANVKAYVHYLVKFDKSKRSISLKLNEVVFKVNGEVYHTKLGIQTRENNFLTTDLTIESPEDIKVHQQKLTFQDDSIALFKQDMAYEDKAFAIRTDEDNEILRRLEDIKAVKKDNKKWLIVIGIESYDSTDSIFYSKRSAETYALVMQKLLGITEGHTLRLIDQDATLGKIKVKLKDKLARIKKGDTLYFYYSGHGIPVPEEKNEPYMLPQDMAAENIKDEKFFRLTNIYKSLTDSNADKVIAVVDSCFSGSTDGKSNLKGVAATALVAKKVNSYNKKKMVVLVAGKGTQYSNKYDEKKQRLFSYYVMDALLKNKRKVKDVWKTTEYQVEETSQNLKMKKQTPDIMGNRNLVF